MNLGFYYDPSSPYCWITSRWLVAALKHREIYPTWRPFSLALQLNELNDEPTTDPQVLEHRASHRILRVIEAAGLAGHNRGEIYTAFGYEHFVNKRPYDNELILEVLKAQHLENLAEAADSIAFDAEILATVRDADDLLGNHEVNIPICSFEVADKRIGYFGPILNSIPNDEEAVRIWDGIIELATTPQFNQLVRPLPVQQPPQS